MHELGIIVHVMRTVEEIAAENNLTEIRSGTCEIGEVSGVVPEYMIDCWGYAAAVFAGHYTQAAFRKLYKVIWRRGFDRERNRSGIDGYFAKVYFR